MITKDGKYRCRNGDIINIIRRRSHNSIWQWEGPTETYNNKGFCSFAIEHQDEVPEVGSVESFLPEDIVEYIDPEKFPEEYL